MMRTKLRHYLGRAGRFKRNLTHNRWYIVFGWRLYFRSRLAAHEGSFPTDKFDSASGRVFLRFGVLMRRAAFDLKSAAVSFPHLGMFGNALASVLPPLARSIHLGLGHVVVHGETVLSDPKVLGKRGRFTLKNGPDLWLNHSPALLSNPIKVLVWDKSLVGPVPEDIQEQTWEALSEVLLPSDLGPCFDEHTLVIHLRGGDAYGGTRFLLNHGQPPLSYYTKIIRSRPWKEVLLVHQGRAMPTLEPIREFCARSDLPCRTQSLSLGEDLKTLLRARVLVAGRGSFIPQVVGLSRCVREVFTYESGFGLPVNRRFIRIHQVTDSSDQYRKAVLANNWKNTPSQRQLMVDYPEDTLTLSLAKHPDS